MLVLDSFQTITIAFTAASLLIGILALLYSRRGYLLERYKVEQQAKHRIADSVTFQIPMAYRYTWGGYIWQCHSSVTNRLPHPIEIRSVEAVFLFRPNASLSELFSKGTKKTPEYPFVFTTSIYEQRDHATQRTVDDDETEAPSDLVSLWNGHCQTFRLVVRENVVNRNSDDLPIRVPAIVGGLGTLNLEISLYVPEEFLTSVLQSRFGYNYFSPRLALNFLDGSRVEAIPLDWASVKSKEQFEELRAKLARQ